MTDNPPPARPTRSRGHSASWWASIATVAAAVIAFGAWWFPRSPDGAPSAADSGSSSPASPSLSAGPLSVAVSHGGQAGGCPSRFFLPKDIDEIRSAMPPEDDDEDYATYLDSFGAWATSVGGWRATNEVQFSVEGNMARATILTGMRVNLVSRKSLTSKTVLTFGECGGGEPVRYFSVDFAPAPPLLRALPGERMDDDGTFVPVEAVDFPFTVSETDPEIFELDVEAGPVCDCLWTVTLSYTQAGKSYTTVIDDGGKPFHAVPTDYVPEYVSIDDFQEQVEK